MTLKAVKIVHTIKSNQFLVILSVFRDVPIPNLVLCKYNESICINIQNELKKQVLFIFAIKGIVRKQYVKKQI